MSTTRCCGKCKFYKNIDAREAMMDPAAKFTVCTWTPIQPFWMPVPYLADGFSSIIPARRKYDEGEDCPTFEEV